MKYGKRKPELELQAKLKGGKLKLKHELELAKLQSSVSSQDETLNLIINSYGIRIKYTLPKVEFSKFGGEKTEYRFGVNLDKLRSLKNSTRSEISVPGASNNCRFQWKRIYRQFSAKRN